MIRIIDDVLGTAIGSWTIDGDCVSIRIGHEPPTCADWTTHDYNVHFSFGIENTGQDTKEIEIQIEGGSWDTLTREGPLLYAAQHQDGPYTPAEVPARFGANSQYAIKVALTSGEQLFVANTYIRDPEKIMADLEEAAVSASAKKIIYGRTLQERELIAYEIGNAKDQETILITSGFHQAEADTLATEAILKWLGTDDSTALRSNFNIVMAPMVNPDGFALGTQGGNSAAVNFYWWFARNRPDICPEAVALWKLASSLNPIGYIDFHAYTVQVDKLAGPYLKPLSHYRNRQVRKAAQSLENATALDTNVMPVRGFSTYAPNTLTSMLTAEFDTLTLAKYHLHLKNGIEYYEKQGLAVLHLMTNALQKAGAVGSNRRPEQMLEKIFRTLRIYWAGLARPVLGHLRRGKLRVPMQRNIIVQTKE